MKNKSDSESGLIISRVLLGLFVLLAGVVLTVFGSTSVQPRETVSKMAQRHNVRPRIERPADNFWAQTNGPQGGDGIALATNSSGEVFVGTQGGGIFRSTDNGETWAGVNNGLTDTNVRALAINNTDQIFAGTWSAGIFRSTDNGENWVAVNNGLKSLGFICLAINSNGDIFAGTPGGGAYRSTDNGGKLDPDR